MSEVTLTIRVKVTLLGLKDFFESEDKAQLVVLEALATSHKVKEIISVKVDSVKADGGSSRMEVRQ